MFITKNNDIICDKRDFMEFMSKMGIDQIDLNTIIEEIAQEYLRNHIDIVYNLQDGLIGDDFYIHCEAIEDCCKEIDECIDALNGPSTKGNRKSDIANRLNNIVSNIRVNI